MRKELYGTAVADPGFPGEGGCKLPMGCANLLFCKMFAKNCMKMTEFGPEVPRVTDASMDPPLDCLNR